LYANREAEAEKDNDKRNREMDLLHVVAWLLSAACSKSSQKVKNEAADADSISASGKYSMLKMRVSCMSVSKDRIAQPQAITKKVVKCSTHLLRVLQLRAAIGSLDVQPKSHVS
jgi:hypothetical protein